MLSIQLNRLNKNTHSVEHMTAIMHNSVPVITTELLADVYGTSANNIKVNHSRNAERFIEGKHYFKLTGSLLREFKRKVTQSNFVKIAQNVRHLILWTERGAARHAKMLDTDKAWDVFEKMEDFYFNQKESESVAVKTTTQDRALLRENELTGEQLPSAIGYLATKAIEGEFLGQEEMPIPNNYSGFTGRLLMELENGEVLYSQVLTSKHHVSTLNDFMEIAQRAGYLLIHKEDMKPMMRALEGYKFSL
ncbi:MULTISPECIES: ORF6N domain-containing protein [Xenorhabdus]|uniref:ORF6N domain-containing protein n=1 Tax=Xenorhabdus TaxID=626 RepID=UPI000907B314|nr:MULTISPECIES: ORF6N domain-containing protein [Xenorhabdus]